MDIKEEIIYTEVSDFMNGLISFVQYKDILLYYVRKRMLLASMLSRRNKSMIAQLSAEKHLISMRKNQSVFFQYAQKLWYTFTIRS